MIQGTIFKTSPRLKRIRDLVNREYFRLPSGWKVYVISLAGKRCPGKLACTVIFDDRAFNRATQALASFPGHVEMLDELQEIEVLELVQLPQFVPVS